MPVRVALLITTYNRPDALNAVLKSVAQQTRVPDEIIICDDGSSSETCMVIDQWVYRLPICHVWCSDSAFRAALVRNLGVLRSRSDILIFVDGDCLMPPAFVENHLEISQSGYLIAGGRYLLSAQKTSLVLEQRLAFSRVFNNWKFLTVPLGPFRDIGHRSWESVRTCNLSVYREDVLQIAGFDESYLGWGREDSDFVVRLMRLGIKSRSGRLATCVAHLHHPKNSRENLQINDQKFQKTLDDPNHLIAPSSVLRV